MNTPSFSTIHFFIVIFIDNLAADHVLVPDDESEIVDDLKDFENLDPAALGGVSASEATLLVIKV